MKLDKITFVIGLFLTSIILFSGILASTAMDHSNGSQDCLFTSNSNNPSQNTENCLNFQTGVLSTLSTANFNTKNSVLLLILLTILSGWFGLKNDRLNINSAFFRFRSYLKTLFKNRIQYFLKELGHWLILLQKQTVKSAFVFDVS